MRTTLLLIAIVLSANAYSQYQWTYIGDIEDGYGFWDAETYAYLENFQLKFTTDGGNSSTTSSLTPGLLSPVVRCHYLDENNIFLVQRDLSELYVYKSTDGGANFTDLGQITALQDYAYNSLFGMHFFDEMTGFLFVRTTNQGDVIDVLIKTTDGGSTWEFAAPTSMTDGAKEILFTGTNNIRIFSDNPDEVFESTDFGTNWNSLGVNPLAVSGDFAGHGNTLWGVGDNGANQPCNVISTDGGATFSEWNIPDFASGGFDDCGERIASADANHVVVSGHENGFSNEVTLYSTDGGQTFTEITFPDTEDHSLEFVFLGDDGQTYFYRSWTDTYAFAPGGCTTSVTEAVKPKNSITVFPNPTTTGIVHLSEAQANIRVYNELGVLVLAGGSKTATLDLSGLESGLYIIQLENEFHRLIKH